MVTASMKIDFRVPRAVSLYILGQKWYDIFREVLEKLQWKGIGI